MSTPASEPNTEPAQPALTSGTYIGLATIVVNGLVFFGLPLDVQQKAYLAAAIAILAPIVAGALIRLKVFSPKTVAEIRTQLAQAQQTAELNRLDAENYRVTLDGLRAVGAIQEPPPVPEPDPVPPARERPRRRPARRADIDPDTVRSPARERAPRQQVDPAAWDTDYGAGEYDRGYGPEPVYPEPQDLPRGRYGLSSGMTPPPPSRRPRHKLDSRQQG